MNIVANFEHRASSSRGKHEGESSFALCDRLSRTRDNGQRQLPTDHDYAVPTREYQTDQSSLKPAPAAARSVLGKRQRQQQRQKQPHGFAEVDRVTPYQGESLVELHYERFWVLGGSSAIRKLAAPNLTNCGSHRTQWPSAENANSGPMVFRVIPASISIWPPGPSTNCFATNNPMPVPTVLRVVKKASNTFWRCSAAIPTPSSWMVKTIPSGEPSASAEEQTRDPSE